MQSLDIKFEQWKKRLLDLGKRNRLINFHETKRSNITMTSPNYDELYKRIVINEEKLSFSFPLKTTFDENGEENSITVQDGDIETTKTLNEQQKTLKVLRSRANNSIQEQGINSLFLTFGILRWKESDLSNIILSSPLVLVPVSLTIESITSPYIIQLHEDEIVVNPSLVFKFENDFGINFPDFDGHEDDITEYLSKIKNIVKRNDWNVSYDVNLTLLSFLKINMYNDLNQNKDKVVSNPIAKAIAGDKSEISTIPNELNNLEHDKNIRPIDTYQIVDADSSQQDAILLSKKGFSFVLQGPPGTGKSQTITNIIAEAIADGKKVLFVSEKLAALEVVKKRITEAGLGEFCLTLHSNKANKKEVLGQLSKTLNMQKISLRDNILYNLSVLEEKRNRLNEYNEQVHTKCMPLNISIYEANGRLAKLSDTQDIIFSIKDVEKADVQLLHKYTYLLNEFSNTIGKLTEDYSENPWYGCNVPVVTHELRNDINVTLSKLSTEMKNLIQSYECVLEETGANVVPSINNIRLLVELLDLSSKSPIIPIKWLSDDIDSLKFCAEGYLNLSNEYKEITSYLLERYTADIFKFDAKTIISTIENNMDSVKPNLNISTFPSNKDIMLNADAILMECKRLQDLLKLLCNESIEISSKFDIEHPNSIISMLELKGLIELILQNPQPNSNWFNYGKIQNIINLLDITKQEQIILKDNLQKIKVNFDDKLLSIDETLNKRFEKDYNNIFKIVGDYNHITNYFELDINLLLSFADNETKQLKSFYVIISSALNVLKDLDESLGIKNINTLKEIDPLINILNTINKNPKPTVAWFDESKDLFIDKIINDINMTLNGIEKETSELLMKYNKDILNIDYKSMLIRFNTEYGNMLKVFKGKYSTDKKTIKGFYKDQNSKLTDNEIILVLQKITSIKEKEQFLIDIKPIATELLGDLYMDSYTNWEIIDKNRVDFKIIKDYFNGKIPDKLKQALLNREIPFLSTQYSAIFDIANNDVINFIQSIFGLDSNRMPINILLNVMNITANAAIDISLDLVEMCKYIIDKPAYNKFTVNDIISTLNSLKEIENKRRWFKDNDVNLNNSFGNYYIGENTNWDNVRNKLEITSQIIAFFGKKQVPAKLISYLENNNESMDDIVKFKNCLDDIISNDIENRLNNLLSSDENQTYGFDKLLNVVGNTENKINVSYTKYCDIFNCAKIEIPYESIMIDLLTLDRVQDIELQVELNKNELIAKLEFKFNGINSDWKEIISSLEYTNKIKDYQTKYLLSNKYIEMVCKDKSFSEWLIKYRDILSSNEVNIKSYFEWYANLFDESEKFYNTNIFKILDRIEKSLNNLKLLEEWIDFRSVRQECRDVRLSEFVEKVEQINMEPNVIVNTFFKRFYRLWLDEMMPRYTAVYNFRSRSHNSIINEFKNLDKLQMEIARLRIKERLSSHLPDSNFATSAVDEVGILERELTKQKKIKPLRRLFKEIPNLLTALKPCLMMSPLSVSIYLQADGYYFDMVIFDEASQVCTEDAIGAIMRGKQVIIAGDSNQLPPTNFFAASISDGEFDSDNDEDFDDIGAYESILEEAVNAIPQRTLKWHYRSRHENLIAFSNSRIYNNELITFPSNINCMPDYGVEYIYVENGIYDRGGKKHNLNEAKCVAELVLEYFKKYPNRSLGVVTFSEAQQQAVENAIKQIRLQNGQYEKYFDEDNEQAFFVKNLENVQGDERDTIIISIGYAKDKNGSMYMNFGPLSRNGGYRRLNVAITRAKYNVKLVGSIHPTDIRIEDTNSEGIKMLRKYIEFAINGPIVLQNELSFTDIVNVDSPFEEAVLDFLIKNGYDVKTQVGCSGYRIDMAVKHPTRSGVFVLGIECDGATYHSARTARERDRIRQTILEDIGWTIYRIWSTDWIKDTKTEGAKLIDAIKMAISNYSISMFDTGSIKQSEVEKKYSVLTEKSYIMVGSNEQESIFENNNPYNFSFYKETDLDEVEKVSDKTQFLANIIDYIVEQECPIHYELLCKRVAPLYGNQKATVKVRNSVDYVLNKKIKNNVIKKGDFCWHKDVKAIQVKIPQPDGDGRPINYISTEELAEAIFVIADKGFGITKKDLFVLTARAFGFNRIGGNITAAMEKACLYLMDREKVKEVDGKIVV